MPCGCLVPASHSAAWFRYVTHVRSIDAIKINSILDFDKSTRLGRDYEAFNDSKRARAIFERGAKAGDASCLYRLGMAHLMGQLSLPPSPALAIPLLSKAAAAASLSVPQPAYVYALLMLDDFASESASIPREMFEKYLPEGSTIELEAQRSLERAAFLNFAPAQ